MTRKQAREEAFILIFEKEFNDDTLEDILALAEEVRDISADDYVKNVFFGVFENIENIDELNDILSDNYLEDTQKRSISHLYPLEMIKKSKNH